MADARSPKHVAVIEDDDLERDALGRLLHAGGFAPDLFESAERFMTVRWNRPWLCLVVDVNLTAMSGLDLQQKLRDEGSTVPIIVTTGDRGYAIRERAEQAGCAGFLLKPVSADAILALVGSIADWART